MNTKTLIPFLALGLLLLQFNANGASHQTHILAFETHANSKAPSDQSRSTDAPLDWAINWNHIYHVMGQQPDHDDKTHKFHYDRFHKHSKQDIIILMIKFLLLITHICTFIGAFIHFLH
ncbi:MAG: hypothetical protein ABIN36_04215 [Ferruginibacter sp.]